MTWLLCVVSVLLCVWSWWLTMRLKRVQATRAAELASGETDLALLMRWIQAEAKGDRARHLDISRYNFGGEAYRVRVDRCGKERTLTFATDAPTLADGVSSVVQNLRGEA